MPSSEIPPPTPARRRIATAAGGSGIGVLFVWCLDLLGVPLTPAAAATFAGMVTTVIIALGREGIKGIATQLWRGANGEERNGNGSP